MSRNLLVCCDGTWNDAENKEEKKRSNVWRFFQMAGGVRGETKEYFPGVGTKGLKDRFKGGIWGFGIGRAICVAYGWLAKNYQPDDKIFLVGFSRGAFTVRSLAGLIGCRGLNTGLATLEGKAFRQGVAEEYQAYRERHAVAQPGPGVYYVGVFDTVGKLGVPDSRKIANLFDNPQNWAFHDTQLGTHVAHGRHALAIDERLADFMPTLWVDSGKGQPIYDLDQDGRTVKQRWFCGHHSDVGGGENQPVTNRALHWMLGEAMDKGLEINTADRDNLKLNDSADLSKSSWSPMPVMPRGVPLLEPVNVGNIIHESVIARRNADANYWPTRRLDAGPISTTVFAGKGQVWQSAGIWVENGQKLVAKTEGRRGGPFVTGYVANGGNPKIDGTWPEHEEFALNKAFKVNNGSGYVYFRVLRQPISHGKGGDRLMWRTLTVSLEQI